MSLVFSDSFDHYNTAAYTSLFWDANPNTRAPNNTSSGRFTGSRSISLNNGDSITKNVAAQATYIVCFALKMGNLNAGTIVQLLDTATVHCDVRISSAGLLSITRNGTQLGIASVGLTASVWYHIQLKVKIDDTTGTIELRVDGVTGSTKGVTAATALDTRNGGNASANQIKFGGSGATFDLDDVVILDTVGATANDFPGDCKITLSMPTGAGNSTQFTPSTGSNWQNVDDNPVNDDTDYNSDATVGHIDLYTRAAITVTGVIIGVKSTMIVRKDDAGARQVAPVVRSGGTNNVGTTRTLGSSYVPESQYDEVDPNTGVAWTEAGLNAAEFGIKVIA